MRLYGAFVTELENRFRGPVLTHRPKRPWRRVASAVGVLGWGSLIWRRTTMESGSTVEIPGM